MKLLLDINDSKANFLLELLNSFNFVKKITPISNHKAQIISDLKKSGQELKSAKTGSLTPRNVDDLLNEL